MKILRDIGYANDSSASHMGDMFLPDDSSELHPIALCIHGGGWRTMDRRSFEGVAEFMQSQGFAAFNIEYRLLGEAPWPACGDDCLLAAKFLLEGNDGLKELKRDKLFIIGASAGGHLALMTGLRLPSRQVSGIVSISGVCDLEAKDPDPHFQFRPSVFWNEERLFSKAEINAASPAGIVKAGQPPVLCTHCPIDNVVGIVHSRNFVARSKELGAKAELFEYNRPLDGHCIWIPGSNPHKLFPEIEAAIARFAKAVAC